MTELRHLLEGTPYVGYAYAYPHKTAYRLLKNPVSLQTLWKSENRDALFLYVHIPFCEMRCGFCNLFTTANPKGDFTEVYLCALTRQARQVREALGDAKFVRLAFGGGTPTFLTAAQLETLFDWVEKEFGLNAKLIPVSVETSPRTAEADKLRLLRERGANRISIGVQSFVEAEANAVGRGQKTQWVESALERIRAEGFPILNVDLIYGLPNQTVASWLCSLQAALHYAPEELYLYPLYVRPLTGLGRKDREWDDIRLACYRAGREYLLSNGYAQISMRMFARKSAANVSAKPNVAYCCQTDGMAGIGCGARSYTTTLHYASEYAVGATGVQAILRDYVTKPDAAFSFADYGFALDAGEQRRRYLIQSLLQVEGVNAAAYRARFGTEILSDFPEWNELEANGLAAQNDGLLRLTPAGIERSDLIGPWLYSPAVQARMDACELE